MSTARHFGTDGIRGVANSGLLSPESQLRLGRALGRFAMQHGPRVILARDPRRSSAMIAGALCAGIAAEGADVIDVGTLPTPGLAALIRAYAGSLGVMVSASHNPMRDNGVKVLAPDGSKLSDADELWLEREMEVAPAEPRPTGAAVGAVSMPDDATERYLAHLGAAFPDLRLDGMRIVVDAANGATAASAPAMLRRLGASVVPIFAAPDGININDGCGAVHPAAMAQAVLDNRADVGVAFDGDGDRLIMAGPDGSVQDGDRILYVCARQLAAAGRLTAATVVGTVMTNFGLELALRELGIGLVRTPVGDRHVAVALREGSFALGGEPSGHLIFGAANRYIGDGLYSALATLAVMRAAGRSLDALSADLIAVPQRLLNVQVAARPPLTALPDLQRRIAAAEAELGGEGRLLVRYSGTENLLRVMVEGRDAAQVERLARDLAQAARVEIEAVSRSER